MSQLLTLRKVRADRKRAIQADANRFMRTAAILADFAGKPDSFFDEIHRLRSIIRRFSRIQSH
jgi:hypothetical protein